MTTTMKYWTKGRKMKRVYIDGDAGRAYLQHDCDADCGYTIYGDMAVVQQAFAERGLQAGAYWVDVTAHAEMPTRMPATKTWSQHVAECVAMRDHIRDGE